MYAELVERCGIASLGEAVGETYPLSGGFVRQTKNGRDYWYFQRADAEGKRRQMYIGPATEEIERLISEHKSAKADFKERRSMVAALKRAGLPAPDPMTGKVLEALAKAGAFRLRAVVVGTIAYQCYGGLLGVKLSGANMTTADLDLAQFSTISLAVEDHLAEPLERVLQSVDADFRPLPHPGDPRVASRYAIGDRYRVDVLTPNRGADSDDLVALPALGTAARPLRYLDYLIYNEERAIALHGGGVAVNVPAPERYALHKLIVSRLRIESRESQEKSRKDLRQAADLITALAEVRPYELAEAWDDLQQRGPKWRRYAEQGIALLPDTARRALEAATSS
ncbi:hypothetical protein C882_1121 [Caenispirillum salinarum AK4]|uniref:Nucleotidyltransferase-like domain-containing protein n=2 Tax=Caenispirillum TaxID=414051 RepID=K9GQA6_9PROT|nr:hypothetical protein C882_1121 [Caenispirillum salinarum AK4]